MTKNVLSLFMGVGLLVSPQALQAQVGASTNSGEITMVPVNPGRFHMGQEERATDYMHPITAEKDRGADWNELPVREVEITRAFKMSATEITNAQYEQFDPTHKSRRPVRGASAEDAAAAVNVSWEDAMNFCRWLSQREGKHYRLPTEAEWEYACRAGTKTLFNMGDVLPDKFQPMAKRFFPNVTYFFPESKPMPAYYRMEKDISLLVKQQPPNAWGLYDMHGNVSEWCLDWHAPYDPAQVRDPVGPAKGDSRAIRGGSHSDFARLLRSANRSSMLPWVRRDVVGFRVVEGQELGALEQTPAPRELTASTEAAEPRPVIDPAKPHFTGPQVYVTIPPNSKGPLFSRHNHDPAIACLPDGDVFVIWYTCEEEPGPELGVAESRLHNGQWSEPRLFWDVADANDHAPVLFVDGNTLYHFNGNKQLPGSVVRRSLDNGKTWSEATYMTGDTQPNESTIKTRDGRILATFDGPKWTAMVAESRDGRNWTVLTKPDGKHVTPGETGGAVAGIHVGMVELGNGDLMAYGRFDWQQYPAYDFKMPMSLSKDGGRTWTYSKSPFPAVSSGQRPTMKRLREGPLLLCSFTDRLARQNEQGETIGVRPLAERDGMMVSDGKGGELKGYGIFAALSWDDGKTWPVRRIITPGGKTPAQATDGSALVLTDNQGEPTGYLAMAQSPDGVIHLISSRNYYELNLAWLTQGTAYEGKSK